MFKFWKLFTTFENLTVSEVAEKMNNGESFTLLDVRTPEEIRQDGGIDGAVSLPLKIYSDEDISFLNGDGDNLIVYCRSGNRSRMACRFLQARGFTPRNMIGGIQFWKDYGFPLAGQKKSYGRRGKKKNR